MDEVVLSLLHPYTKKVLGFNISKTLVLSLPNGNVVFYAGAAEWQKLVDRVRQTFFSKSAMKRYLAEYTKVKREFLSNSALIASRLKKSASKKSLGRLYENFLESNIRFMVIGQWFAFYLAEIADEAMRELSQSVASRKNREAMINAALTPARLSQIRKERISLLRIALEKNANKRNRLLGGHLKKFSWIPCIGVFEPKPWDLEFFKRELSKIKHDPRKELMKFHEQQTQAKKFLKDNVKLLSSSQRYLLKHSRIGTFLKDDRDDTRRLGYYNARPLYQAISEILAVKPADLVYLTNTDILDGLLRNKTFGSKEINSRKKGYVILNNKRITKVKVGKIYQSHYKNLNRLVKTDQIKGIPASGGVVRGKVRVVLNASVLDKVKKGEILVTMVTHPDYLPAMRVAKAIVTNEGGLTSHAAIVARELKIPCIVGTKVATQLLKDGDMVEVDANKGMVRKI
ncbi:MAG: hypothetical protein A3J07_03765 [Candidatus Doudnabacteria bacterium RIFCSPLOWO2_02_FULL_49_13]|uniref:PEP-utilising enzyme mobile domain-containing protein n=1 Tax=Candidatus Doudnabacteria bacterium RIFCSPHIGHO2_12_FULL_48_16 TaxID=1817838 RepID=A0A1F5PJB0_9BACT|nr:MAG: hypothetical protein A3B77_02575 [Candidatus Doudnabacteria bacterium RIFCSPHIGHO2_02_FULL_49_24]OGE89592.1 MAG: hypothetical protein A2760_03780 [Candidatus Doudnabacteria bacterium RIFCSPHIGHO2_01_FULL_50_67]OGE90035.1 MAG: hypothetical protein A3E29_02910 [Candidatus Doudnabacteria bacterium RIFCSPHIGHO2_12_FULL_48_16]OGE96608.1 MAG: hypothetical protein A2990_00220 [Candidatus Doudnabacteria bacterium RIFCSPLOWO2_01_FULL_49_40]OGF03178.1 MAG: hypothetical protein A3J07_03765 [Candid